MVVAFSPRIFLDLSLIHIPSTLFCCCMNALPSTHWLMTFLLFDPTETLYCLFATKQDRIIYLSQNISFLSVNVSENSCFHQQLLKHPLGEMLEMSSLRKKNTLAAPPVPSLSHVWFTVLCFKAGKVIFETPWIAPEL